MKVIGVHESDEAQGKPVSGPTAPGGGPEEASPPSWKPLIIGLLMALVMATIMATAYVSANHAAVAHDLPWGQVGYSRLTNAVEKEVSLDVHQYDTQADLEQAANETKIYGGFVADSNTLILSEASSLWAPAVLPLAYEKAAKQENEKLAVPKVINKLPSQDPEGVVPGLVLFVVMVAGYLSSTFAMARTKTAAAHRRVAVLFGFAVVASLVFNLIVGPILGGYPDVGSNFLPLWGAFSLIILAVALLAATLQSLIGPLGTLITVIIVVFIGNPSTGGLNGVAFLPPFWQEIGKVLPPRSGLYLIRNTLYFDGNAIMVPIIVLSIYVIVGAALVTIFSWGRLLWWRGPKGNRKEGHPQVLDPDEEVGTAATPPG
jgi:hypothetical protein